MRKQSHKLKSPEQYDEIICAELPNKEDNPHLSGAVVKHMMHRPRGELDRNNTCMTKKIQHCIHKYPEAFCPVTTHEKTLIQNIGVVMMILKFVVLCWITDG